MDRVHTAPELLETLVRQAEASGASDIHIQLAGPRATAAFRLDGVMTAPTELPADLAPRLIGRIKYLARLKTWQQSLPQDGRIAQDAVGAHSDLRVATYPTVDGEKTVLRLFARGHALGLGELGFPPEARDALAGVLRGTAGLLLLTGPAGSGKTTTIYACLRHLAEGGGRHVITVEDPVERILEGLMQTEINEAAGLTFAKAARHLLRQDPEVLVIGEIRDEETARIAVRAALTGHLVISTLHAGSCRGVFERLLELCGDRSAALAAVALVLNQRLIRRRCAACDGAGCPQCLETGFHGRLPLIEWVRVDQPTRARLRAEGPTAIAPASTLADAADCLVEQSLTTDAERARVLGT